MEKWTYFYRFSRGNLELDKDVPKMTSKWTFEWSKFSSASGREIAIHQLYGLLITTAIAGLGGLISGLLNPSEYFDDTKDWETDGVFANDRHDDVES